MSNENNPRIDRWTLINAMNAAAEAYRHTSDLPGVPFDLVEAFKKQAAALEKLAMLIEQADESILLVD